MIYLSRPKNFNPKFEIAICFCEFQDKILLLLRQAWESAPNKWCIPGGRVEKGEKSAQTIIRETKEETGLKFMPKEFEQLKSIYIRYPNFDFISHLFHVSLKKKSQVKINQKEHKKYKWVALNQALEMDLVLDGYETIKIFQEAKND